jgi:hypothetical protein
MRTVAGLRTGSFSERGRGALVEFVFAQVSPVSLQMVDKYAENYLHILATIVIEIRVQSCARSTFLCYRVMGKWCIFLVGGPSFLTPIVN